MAAPGTGTPLGTPLSTLPCDVTIDALTARPDLNGKRGRAISLDAESGRYHVVLHDGGDTLALRAKNLRETFAAARPQRIIVEVSLSHDQKRIAILSTTRLRNSSSHALEVRLAQPGAEPESIHSLAPGGVLPLPLRADGGNYRLCLRPASGEQQWCAMTHVPNTTGEALPAATVPLECAPAVGGAPTWHCLLHTSGGASGGTCELSVQPPIELRNLLAGPLRFELLGSGVAVGRTLASGESLKTHSFAQGTAVSFSMQVAGYTPSDRQLVAAPSTYDDDVLCRAVPLHDRHGNALEVRIHYEHTRGCVHTLSLHAAYWVVNNTGLPLSIRELGAAHGFTGDEAAVVREVVCENQRRATALNGFATDPSLPFSDARLQRRYTNLAAVWLPPGWVWLDDAWDVERSRGVDEAGWQYAHNYQAEWDHQAGLMSLVRQRRWYRHRAVAARMDAKTAGRLSDEAIGRMTAAELRLTIASGGLAHRDCASREALRARAREARDSAQSATARDASASASATAAGGSTNGEQTVPLMPPVSAGSRLQLQLPGSVWSPPVLIEAAGTHGLLEIDGAPTPHSAHAPSPSNRVHERPGSYQLGLSINSSPGVFGRSKMLTVSPRVLLCNTLPKHAIAYKQHGSAALGEVLFPGDNAPFHWRSAQGEAPRLLSVSLLRSTVDRADDTADALRNADWSCAFAIDDVGDMTLVIKPPDPETRRQKLFLNVDVQVSGAQPMWSDRNLPRSSHRPQPSLTLSRGCR